MTNRVRQMCCFYTNFSANFVNKLLLPTAWQLIFTNYISSC